MCVCVYVCMYVCTCVCVVYMCMCVCSVHVCMCVYVYMCVYVCSDHDYFTRFCSVMATTLLVSYAAVKAVWRPRQKPQWRVLLRTMLA